MKLKEFIQKNTIYLILGFLSLCFFLSASSYNYLSQSDNFIKWGSPDETANYIFAKLYAQEGSMRFYEKYNLYANDIIHPRSMRSDAGIIKPVSFLGIILIFGKIASLTSYKVLPYLIPSLAAVGIIFYFLLLKNIFGPKISYLATLILIPFPAYIYYSVRSMFHNVLFVVLLIIGLYYAILMARKYGNSSRELGKYIYPALAGLFFGLAIITRTSELLWIIPLLLFLWIFNIKKIGFTKLIIFIIFLFLCFIPVLYWNQILYQSPFNGGYAQMNASISRLAAISTEMINPLSANKKLLVEFKNIIFYFGFHPLLSIKTIYYYFIKMFYWIFWSAIAGCFIFLYKWRQFEKKHWLYLLSYLIISAILLLYYGSWQFYDNPDQNQATIGNSYTRYWLPVYLGALPFVSIFILKLTRLFKKRLYINLSRFFIIILIYFVSIWFVLFGSEEGIITINKKNKDVKKEFNKVLELTENNAAIITKYHDKLLFPERKVIVGQFDNKDMNSQYRNLVNYIPVYYYNFTLPPIDFDYLNNKRLKEAGLRLAQKEEITEDFTLYRLMPIRE